MNLRNEAGLRPFSDSGYEILDDELATRNEVAIWSVNPMTPRLGDLFLVESGGRMHDVAVIKLTTFRGGWSATARVVETY
jgi:hypothetical protein